MNKYRNIPVVIDGIRFASKAEGRRYSELKLLEKAGEISKLELQPRYKIIVEGILICTYVADFKFEQRHKSGMFFTVVEDVKGILTPIYKLKKKLVKAVCGVDIKEAK